MKVLYTVILLTVCGFSQTIKTHKEKNPYGGGFEYQYYEDKDYNIVKHGAYKEVPTCRTSKGPMLNYVSGKYNKGIRVGKWEFLGDFIGVEGTYKNDKMNGLWKLTTLDLITKGKEHVSTLLFKDGIPTGKFIYKATNTSLSVSFDENGFLDGELRSKIGSEELIKKYKHGICYFTLTRDLKTGARSLENKEVQVDSILKVINASELKQYTSGYDIYTLSEGYISDIPVLQKALKGFAYRGGCNYDPFSASSDELLSDWGFERSLKSFVRTTEEGKRKSYARKVDKVINEIHSKYARTDYYYIPKLSKVVDSLSKNSLLAEEVGLDRVKKILEEKSLRYKSNVLDKLKNTCVGCMFFKEKLEEVEELLLKSPNNDVIKGLFDELNDKRKLEHKNKIVSILENSIERLTKPNVSQYDYDMAESSLTEAEGLKEKYNIKDAGVDTKFDKINGLLKKIKLDYINGLLGSTEVKNWDTAMVYFKKLVEDNPDDVDLNKKYEQSKAQVELSKKVNAGNQKLNKRSSEIQNLYVVKKSYTIVEGGTVYESVKKHKKKLFKTYKVILSQAIKKMNTFPNRNDWIIWQKMCFQVFDKMEELRAVENTKDIEKRAKKVETLIEFLDLLEIDKTQFKNSSVALNVEV